MSKVNHEAKAKDNTEVEVKAKDHAEAEAKARAEAEAKAKEEAEAKERAEAEAAKREEAGGDSPGRAQLTDEQRDAVRAAWARLSVKLPRELISGGHWEVPEDDREALPDLGVPDGIYRVSGADYALAFHDGRLIGAAAAASAPVDAYVEVPSR